MPNRTNKLRIHQPLKVNQVMDTFRGFGVVKRIEAVKKHDF